MYCKDDRVRDAPYLLVKVCNSFISILQCITTACYAERCSLLARPIVKVVKLPVCHSVCSSVRHTLELRQND